MFCFCLVGCGSPDISLQHVKTKVVDLVPEPQTWSLDRFKHEWSLAKTGSDRSKVLTKLSKLASLSFDWKSFWNAFKTGELRWPLSSDGLDGRLFWQQMI